MIDFTWHDEPLSLLPQRAVWWKRTNTVLIADPHFGKAADFRSRGVYVPEGTTAATLARIEAALLATGATRLIVLGDLLHGPESGCDSIIDQLAIWRVRQSALETIINVRGNHDERAGDPPDALGVSCVDAPYRDGRFTFVHDPANVEVCQTPVLAGHVHPRVRLRDADGTSMRAPCFWFSESVAVLPAIGSFTGTATIRPRAGEAVFAIASDEVVDVSRVSAGNVSRRRAAGSNRNRKIET